MQPGMKTGWPAARYSAGISAMARREGAGGALAVHAELPAAVAARAWRRCGRRRTPGGRVGGVGARARVRIASRTACAIAARFAQAKLAAAAIARQVVLALGRRQRRAGELAIGKLDPVPGHGGVHALDVVGAHLMAEPARARVDEDGHGAGLQAVGRARTLRRAPARPAAPRRSGCPTRRFRAGPSRAGAPAGRRRPGRRRRAVPATPCAPGRPRVPMPRSSSRAARALAQDPVELGARQLQGRLAARPGRRQAGDLVDERLLAVAQARRLRSRVASRRTPQLMS